MKLNSWFASEYDAICQNLRFLVRSDANPRSWYVLAPKASIFVWPAASTWDLKKSSDFQSRNMSPSCCKKSWSRPFKQKVFVGVSHAVSATKCDWFSAKRKSQGKWNLFWTQHYRIHISSADFPSFLNPFHKEYITALRTDWSKQMGPFYYSAKMKPTRCVTFLMI